MPRQAKSKVRKLIEGWVDGKGSYDTQLLDAGIVFIVPSSTEPLPAYHLVARLVDGKKGTEYWVCSCKGFRYSREDKCRHITESIERGNS